MALVIKIMSTPAVKYYEAVKMPKLNEWMGSCDCDNAIGGIWHIEFPIVGIYLMQTDPLSLIYAKVGT
jgi:hypothetical protein